MDTVEIEDVLLFSDGKDIVVEVKIAGRTVEIIRTCQDGNVSHGVGANGIAHLARRQALNDTPRWAMGHA
ncbi:MAG: hypothetical protein ACR2QF_07275 [Geminicoccaceae bacterium]